MADRPDEYEVAAARIRAKEPVGDHYLYGPKAKELIGRRLVSEADLEAYRRGHSDALRRAYGDDAAREAMRHLRNLHAASVRPSTWADRNPGRIESERDDFR